MRETRGFLVIADISGYTKFVRAHRLRHVPIVGEMMTNTSSQHAEVVITDLLEVIIDTIGTAMSLNKLEGDAAFFVKESVDPNVELSLILERAMEVFEAFQRRLHELIFCQTCQCDCCQQMGDLKVKIMVHYGEFWVKRIAQFEEVAGEDVILVHRLLKNSIGSNEYLAITRAVSAIGSSMLNDLPMEQYTESYDLGMVELDVYFPKSESVTEFDSVFTWISRWRQMHSYFDAGKDREALRLEYLS